MCQDPELDLGVVRTEQLMSRRGHESVADAPPEIGADGNVLQVGVNGRESSRGSHRLFPTAVDASCLLVDQRWESLDVRSLQFGDLADLEDHLRQWMLVGQGFQGLRVRRT